MRTVSGGPRFVEWLCPRTKRYTCASPDLTVQGMQKTERLVMVLKTGVKCGLPQSYLGCATGPGRRSTDVSGLSSPVSDVEEEVGEGQ